MEFRILGTGSATPQLQRNPSAFTLAIDNFLILIDCGEGTQYRLLQYKIKSFRIKYILISHLHGDHYFGLIGLISTMNMQKRKETLTVFGPRGLNEIITQQLKYSGSILNFKLEFVQTNPDNLEEIYFDDTIKIDTFPLKHRIECTGFLVTKKNSKRKIIPDKLPPNFPVAFYRLLKDGLDVHDELNGKVYTNAEYTADGSSEKKFAYCSDTIFDKSIIKYVENADLLYHESTFTRELENRAHATFHSTASQAAEVAALANVGQLVIGHFSSRYKTEELFLEEAKVVFPETSLAEEGKNFII